MVKAKTEKINTKPGLRDLLVDKPYDEIDLSRIDFSDTPPQIERRLDFNDDEMSELADSIKAEGVIQPILVRRKGNRFECCAGERRVRASRIAGLSKIPAVIKDLSDEQVLKAQYHENIKRTKLSPLAEAYTYHYLEEEEGKSIEQIAAETGKTLTYISKRKLLVKLSDKCKDFLRKKLITPSHADEIIRFTHNKLPSEQDDVLELAFSNFGFASQALYTVAKFTENIEQRYLLRLDKAPFNPKSEKYGMIACINCDLRTGAKPLLYDDYLGDKDCCTNRSCFESKSEVHRNLNQEKENTKSVNNSPAPSTELPKTNNSKTDDAEREKIILKNRNDDFEREIFNAVRLRVARKAVLQVDGNVPGTNSPVFKKIVARMWQMQCRFDEDVSFRIAETIGLNPDTFLCEDGEPFSEYLKNISELTDTLLRRLNYLLIFECHQTEEEIKEVCEQKGIDYQILDAEERLAQVPMNRKDEFRYYLHELERGNREAIKPKRFV